MDTNFKSLLGYGTIVETDYDRYDRFITEIISRPEFTYTDGPVIAGSCWSYQMFYEVGLVTPGFGWLLQTDSEGYNHPPRLFLNPTRYPEYSSCQVYDFNTMKKVAYQ